MALNDNYIMDEIFNFYVCFHVHADYHCEIIEAKPSESCLDKWYELSYEPRTGMCAHSGFNSLSLKEVINSFKSELSRRSK